MDDELKAQVGQLIEERMEQEGTPPYIREVIRGNLEVMDFIDLLITATVMWEKLFRQCYGQDETEHKDSSAFDYNVKTERGWLENPVTIYPPDELNE